MKDGQMKRAFTIIEVILVLSISSLFAVGMMVGWNINIERQRYNDTVNTLKSDIQGIFNEVENPTNSRSGNFDCVDNGDSVRIVTGNTASSRRGATDCILLGKLINLGNNTFTTDNKGVKHESYQNEINIVDIIGLDIDASRDCSGVCTNHFSAMKAAKISFDFTNIKTINLQWNGQYKNITDNRNNKLFPPDDDGIFIQTGSIRSFAILRSPIDNTIFSLAFPRTNVVWDRDLSSMNDIRKTILRPSMVIGDNKKIDICVSMGSDRLVGIQAIFGRNKVIRIGGSASAIEVAPLDGAGSISCGNGIGFDDVKRED